LFVSDQFSRQDVALILQRTAELERARGTDIDAITGDDLQKIAEELGMSKVALGQALAESKAGLLAPPAESTALDRFYGGTTVEARRFVPGSAVEVRKVIEEFFRAQAFDIDRRGGDWTTWRRTNGIGTWLKRQAASAYKLPRHVDYKVRIAEVAGGPHPVLVQVEIDIGKPRRSRVKQAALAIAVGIGGAAIGVMEVPGGAEVVPVLAGLAAGGGGTLWTRGRYRDMRGELEAAIGRLLDFLEHEPARLATQPRKDVVSRVVDFFAGL
jgi:hypothetical protein